MICICSVFETGLKHGGGFGSIMDGILTYLLGWVSSGRGFLTVRVRGEEGREGKWYMVYGICI